MDELENYRRKIGSFSNCKIPYKLHNSPVGRYCGTWLLCVVLAIVGVSALALETDPSIEKNPGPTYEQVYRSLVDSEKPLFLDIQRKNSKIITHSSHRYYLRRCVELEIIAQGYIPKCRVATATPDDSLHEKHSKIMCEYCTKRMLADFEHHNKKVEEFFQDRNFLLSELKHYTTSLGRYETLTRALDTKFTKDMEFEQKLKIKKIKKLSKQQTKTPVSEQWLPELNLTKNERSFIVKREEICDKIIDAACALISRDNPLLQIQSASFPHTMLTYSPFQTLHIHHNGRHHFVTSSSLTGLPIQVYDSLYTPNTKHSINPDLRKQITAIYSPDSSEPTTFLCPMTHRQKGSVDCGIYAIAYAVDLAHGNNPCQIIYDQSSLRNHLLDSLEKGTISPFPRFRSTSAPKAFEITNDIPQTNKWSPPKKPSNQTHKTTSTPICQSNKFATLKDMNPDDLSNYQTHTHSSNMTTTSPYSLNDYNSSGNDQKQASQPRAEGTSPTASSSTTSSNESCVTPSIQLTNSCMINPTELSDFVTIEQITHKQASTDSIPNHLSPESDLPQNSTTTSPTSSNDSCGTLNMQDADSNTVPPVCLSDFVTVQDADSNTVKPAHLSDFVTIQPTTETKSPSYASNQYSPTSVSLQNTPLTTPTAATPSQPPITPPRKSSDHMKEPHLSTPINQPTTNCPSKHQSRQHLGNSHWHSSSVRNLSSRQLTPDEMSVLELGLGFSPSVKQFNKEQLADDFFYFIRRLKLREYFFQKNNNDEQGKPVEPPAQEKQGKEEHEVERSKSKWVFKNPSWYPKEVRNNHSVGLETLIKDTLYDTRRTLEQNESNILNNLNQSQRNAIKNLINDKSIIIKPSDKCGSVVVMDVIEYEQECLQQLENTEYYKEVFTDPNTDYKTLVKTEANALFGEHLISEQERDKLAEGDSTPAFYGLPKLHKTFSSFPSLRPICSGSGSCTKALSELLDTFLKPLAKKLNSYVQDTTDFLRRIKDLSFPANDENVFLSVMDVESLYTNIEQEEGAKACKEHLDTRKNKSFSSELLQRLILLVLRCNTMVFQSRLFHQIKGTAMGTPMAVNFANLFMGKFEQHLLNAYESLYGMRPALWLRYIDDVFVVWIGTRDDFIHFMEFCNNFAASEGYHSKIKFKFSPPSTSVDFLDTTITLQKDGSLSSTLFSKPCASHQYLHHNSYHPLHLKNSLPKSQFLRIRRICSQITDYDHHSSKFITYFQNRGYKLSTLNKTALEVRQLNRDELLLYKRKVKDDRIPLVLTYHHKFKGISKIIHTAYERMIRTHPQIKEVFPAPPLVSFRRAPNLRDKLVRANHHKTNIISQTPIHKTRTSIDHLMNNTNKLKNVKSGRVCTITGGPSNTAGVIYAAECTKHSELSIGHTGQQMNVRFNKHRWDIINDPTSCELVEHFANKGCDFRKDLSISILETTGASENYREYKEDKWMCRLRTISPTGMNKRLGEFGQIYRSLFL